MFTHRWKLSGRTLNLFSVLFVLIAASNTPSALAQASLAQKESAVTLPQYTAGGHVLGFTAQGIYAVAGSHALHIDFINANLVQPQADSPTHMEDGSDAAPLSRVRYMNLWNGITLTYTSTPNGIYTTTYRLTPGADPTNIRLHYNVPLKLNADGSLKIVFQGGELTETAPVAWQEIQGKQAPVPVSFQVRGGEVGFALGEYDPRFALTIDPSLAWNTFLGGSNNDTGQAIVLDGSGNIYIAGTSDGSWGSPIRAYIGGGTDGTDAFVAKLDPSGALIWNTFLGGAGSDRGQGISIDAEGNLYVIGFSYGSWGIPLAAYTAGNNEAYAAKLDPSGALVWNTFLGGTGSSMGSSISVSQTGIYVSGDSNAAWGSPVRAYSGADDAFAAELDLSGNLVWNTFLGGNSTDSATDIVADGSGNTYVTGWSQSTWGSPVQSYSSGGNGFAAKLDPNGNLIWNTFLGGNGQSSAIAVDQNGNVFVTGNTQSDFLFNGIDAFAAKMDSNGNLIWNRLLGGEGSDYGWNIAVSGSGDIYITGHSNATWGTPFRSYSRSYSGYEDAFVAKLDASGRIDWNTFLGGDGNDVGADVAVDGTGSVYVTGNSTVSWGSPLSPYNSFYRAALVAKLNPLDVLSNTPANPNPTGAASVGFKVVFSEPVTGVDASDFTLATTGSINGASISGVSGSGDTYTVTANTGSGEGTIRLDVVDDDTIQDAAGNFLGGAGVGNGNFITGETYTIDKTPPTVLSIERADPSPTTASSVDFHVVFSKPVTGSEPFFAVNPTDFTLTTTGTLHGLSIRNVSGSDAAYTVAVNTGSGAGTIRLDVADNDNILDRAGNPLGGAGVGNGNFTTGEAYELIVPSLQDPSFELSFGYPWIWKQSSWNFGSPLCVISVCGNGGGTAGPRTGLVWGWFGGTANPESASLSQAINIRGGDSKLKLQFYFWIGAIAPDAATKDVFTAQMDDVTLFSTNAKQYSLYPSYTPVLVDASAFSDGGSHTITFSSNTTHGVNFNLDDVTLADSTFFDVPSDFWAQAWIERLYSAGITGGCSNSPLKYCPNGEVTRAQMAVFLEKGLHGPSFTPPVVPLTFTDTAGNFAQYWIEALKSDGITSGCGGSSYCPDQSVTRAQMAIFLLKSEHGSVYSPPSTGPETGFNDVPTTYWAASWIEQLAKEGITSGCAPNTYCPDQSVTRAQMAAFLVKTFALP